MKKDDCIFCKIANGDIPTNALYEDDIVKVIFDLGPASKGHVLILPKNHFDNVYGLDNETAAHIFQVAVKIADAMKSALKPDGINIVQNNGEAAGQTVFHFHVHIIPRYENGPEMVTWEPGKAESGELEKISSMLKAELES